MASARTFIKMIKQKNPKFQQPGIFCLYEFDLKQEVPAD